MVRKGWVIVFRNPPLPDMVSQLYRTKKEAKQAAAEAVLRHPELIGKVFVGRGEEEIPE